MKKDHDWTSLALLASNAVQNFQLKSLRGQISDLNRANVSRDLRELSERKAKEQENRLLEFAFQIEEMIEAVTSGIASNPYAGYVKAEILGNLLEAVDLTSDKFCQFTDKDRIRKLNRMVADISTQAQTGLTVEQKERGKKCARFVVEQPALDELVRVRKRVDELGDREWTAISPEHREKLISMFGDHSTGDYVKMQQERTAFLKSELALGILADTADLQRAVEENVVSEDERLIQECIQVIRREKVASTSILQRRLRLGYSMATQILDDLERRGIVGPATGAEPRKILIALDSTDRSRQKA